MHYVGRVIEQVIASSDDVRRAERHRSRNRRRRGRGEPGPDDRRRGTFSR
jgi:hypothetical protein